MVDETCCDPVAGPGPIIEVDFLFLKSPTRQVTVAEGRTPRAEMSMAAAVDVLRTQLRELGVYPAN